ncbi:hypothetical protein [Methylomonas sp. DH-1]|uniref:hypothetical protein n=1 Tax=Methylomonas sp. (strain DH-1) TaxID=1727196 RepID=UPI000AD45052|nr:hypothetical protein [Methylomonas sp. DH-1]
MQEQQSTASLDDIQPYQVIPDIYPHLYSKKGWSWAVKQRKHNGLAKAFRKVGKQLFVNTRVLAECIDSKSDT